MRNVFLILIGFVFLILWLIIGYPFEIINLTIDRFLMVVVSGIIIVLVFITTVILQRVFGVQWRTLFFWVGGII